MLHELYMAFEAAFPLPTVSPYLILDNFGLVYLWGGIH